MDTTPSELSAAAGDRSVVCGGLLLQLARGWFVLLVVETATRLYGAPASANVVVLLSLAAAACGAGIGAGLDRWLRTRSPVPAISLVLPVVLVSVGASLPWLVSVSSLLIVAFILGIGFGHPWNHDADLLRTCSSVRHRWTVLSLYNLCLPVGILGGVLASRSDLQTLPPVLAGSTGLLTLLFFRPAHAVSRQAALARPQDTSQASGPPSVDGNVGAPAVDTTRGETEAAMETDEDSCGEEECCGGNRRAFETPPVLQGAGLAAISTLTAFALALPLVFAQTEASWLYGLSTAAAVIFGFGLLQATAPRTGYVIAILPFLLGLLLTGAWMLLAGGGLSGALPWLTAFCAGGVWAGLQSQAGELYADCPPQFLRSQVVAGGYFVASILILPVALAARHWSDSVFSGVTCVVVSLTALAALRTIRTPVLSSLGRDDDAAAEDEEFQDVVSALQKQN